MFLYVDLLNLQDQFMIQNSLLQQFEKLISADQKKSITISMIRCIEEMFDYAYILNNNNFRKAILNNPKGYVPFSLIFKQQKFIKHLAIGGLPAIKESQFEQMGIYLSGQIKKFSKKLWSNPGSIRKIKNYQEKQITPVYVQNFPIQNNCQQFQNLIASKCNYSKIEYDKEQTCAFVYTKDVQALLNLNGYRWKDDGFSSDTFRVYSCEEFERLEQGRRISPRLEHLYLSKGLIQYPCFQQFKQSSSAQKIQYESEVFNMEEQFQDFIKTEIKPYYK